MVKDAIYRVYGVRPVRVNLIAMKGKAVTFKRIRGKRKDWKKAIVFMPKGQKIEVFEGV
jgi:large subunit ribosomal protein L23